MFLKRICVLVPLALSCSWTSLVTMALAREISSSVIMCKGWMKVTALCSSRSVELLLMGSWTDITAEQHLMIRWSWMCRMGLHDYRRDEVYILSRDEAKVVQNGDSSTIAQTKGSTSNFPVGYWHLREIYNGRGHSPRVGDCNGYWAISNTGVCVIRRAFDPIGPASPHVNTGANSFCIRLYVVIKCTLVYEFIQISFV
jgi:hypothetical protein